MIGRKEPREKGEESRILRRECQRGSKLLWLFSKEKPVAVMLSLPRKWKVTKTWFLFSNIFTEYLRFSNMLKCFFLKNKNFSIFFCSQTEPTVAPSQVCANSLSSSEIEVSWNAVPWKLSNGHLLGYEVMSFKIN